MPAFRVTAIIIPTTARRMITPTTMPMMANVFFPPPDELVELVESEGVEEELEGGSLGVAEGWLDEGGPLPPEPGLKGVETGNPAAGFVGSSKPPPAPGITGFPPIPPNDGTPPPGTPPAKPPGMEGTPAAGPTGAPPKMPDPPPKPEHRGQNPGVFWVYPQRSHL